MKKISIVLASLIAFATAAAFADDALVLPAGVLRITTALSYATAEEQYDKDGEAVDLSNNISSVTAFNFGAALEYGVNDWITAALQWAPGYTFGSEAKDFQQPTPYPGIYLEPKANVNDAADLFAGAKLQLVGPKAPVANEQFRAAVAPGMKIPFGDIDWKKQYDNVVSEDDVTISAADRHALGFGVRGYADYVVNKMFFVNAFVEYIYYLEKKDSNISPSDTEVDVDYGYDLKLEFEPIFQYMLSDGLRLGASLPLTYTMAPDVKINGTKQDDSASSEFVAGPNVSLFFLKTFMPMEVKVQYFASLSGVNTTKTNTLALVGKFYLKF